MFAEKNYYYHVTMNPEWGQEVTLIPRSDGLFRHHLEPKTPRICVAPTVAQCLIALNPESFLEEKIYIYQTKEKVNAVRAKSKVITDAHITDEMWLLEKTDFGFIGEMDGNDFLENVWGEYYINDAITTYPYPKFQKIVFPEAVRYVADNEFGINDLDLIERIEHAKRF